MNKMTRKQINDYITKELDGWQLGHQIDCRLYDPNVEWDGQNISLPLMRKFAKPGETWWLVKWHWHSRSRGQIDSMEITIPLSV